MSWNDLTILHFSPLIECSTCVDKDFTGYGTLQFMSRGRLELIYEQERFVIQGTHFWCCWFGPRTQFHAAPGTLSWRHSHVAFNGPLLHRWLAAGLLFRRPQKPVDALQMIRKMNQLQVLLKRQDPWSQSRAINFLEGILLELAEARVQKSANAPWLMRTLAWMEEDKSHRQTPSALARELSMGLTTLRQKFRAATGVPLHTYLVQKRIAAARQLLSTSEQPIKSIAEQLGYRDVFFFSRQFHRCVGVPPAEFRRSRQQ